MSGVDISTLEQRVRVAARALGRHGLVQAWGHCSARIDAESFVVCAARPMGRIEVGEPGTIVPIEGALPPGVLGEVRIHQQIYRRRPDVGGICRFMPPHVVALSTLRSVPKPRHGVGAFNAACRFWDDPRLLRDDALAAELAAHLGQAPSLVMRANGAVTVGPNIELATGFAWCLEDAARIETLVRSMVDVAERDDACLTAEEIDARQVSSGAVFERLWDYLTADDPESLGSGAAFPVPQWGRP
ncbi:class II aldolase/adducin family protein [Pseudomonas asiatica]|jgi:HCOMODA/2-hydroxy-3-carboxy-muconic semialdehyde decarboxylase|uniref:2-hydroxy-3-carboxy-6-oxo-7-methylocta-2, 4-dienate decarboxylase n=4 Tax=Pseudomonas putida group TaxID=136845 RepID=Q51979_PSEPU|nr:MULTISPECIES: class II aldolase/adducin family protein [Pseudomonas]AAB62290.1 HCOMODA decarboxylase [Pseudomonas putida]ABA10799.1 2-hydroxy-3-carboxy-6-oxo-7-methylocta-2,4-dienate decarboxylase [Pseudomonas putida]ADI95388.1 CmtD [Pseudomonas putida DOT-T1E]AFO50082.1 class II aldolase/adducin family protein [Pseudomonas putida DOT-T1E]AHC82448.1 aldolase [Pseudomonas monteilii SB3078]